MKVIAISLTLIFISAGIAADYSVNYERVNGDSHYLTHRTLNYSTGTVEKDGVVYTVIDFDGGVTTNKKGYAELPFVSSTIQLGNDRNVTMKVKSSKYHEIKLDHPLLPSRGVFARSSDHKNIPYIVDEASLTDDLYPAALTDLYRPFIFRDTRGVNVVFYPFMYNAATNTLRIYTTIEVSLTENNEAPVNPLFKYERKIAQEADAMYRSLYINYNESKSLYIGDKGDILVIHTRENGGLEALRPYIDWKKKLGHKVHAVEVPDGTDLSSERIIKNAYLDNPDILFVQLVGDWENLRSAMVSYGFLGSVGPTDPALGFVAGDDKYQDVIIGRFSVKSAEELAVQINKGINYEKHPDSSGDWYKKAIALSSDEGEGYGDDGESDERHNDIIIDHKLLPSSYTEGYRVYQSLNGSASQISSYINSGASLINFTGHGYTQGWGGPSYSSSHVNNLTNGHKLPFIVSVACVTGLFSGSSDCFAEAWMKKVGGGAVAGWFSTINQPWLPPMRGQDYFADILVGGYDYSVNPGSGISTSGQRYTYGSITVNSAVLTLSEAPGDPSTIATIETWTVFGDAALQVRRDSPKAVENMIEAVFVNSYKTRVLSGGEPLEGLTVSVFRDGTAYAAYTDSNGEAEVEHGFTGGYVTVTISGFNIDTYSKDLPVTVPEGPYLAVRDYGFSERRFGGNSGIELVISNIGLEETSGIEISVSTDSDYITMISSAYSFDPELILTPGGDDLITSGDISFMISPYTPDRERVRFSAVIRDSNTGKEYISYIYLTVESPAINIIHEITSPNSIQGTEQQVVFTIQNKGSADFGSFRAELIQTTDFDIAISGPADIGSLPPGGIAEISFICTFGTEIPNSSYAGFELEMTSASGLTEKYNYSRVVGITENFASGDFNANNWEFSGGSDWVIDNEIFFDAGYSASSGVVGHNGNASLSISFDYIQDGTISFFRKISSELKYDELKFYVNGDLKGKWSGEIDWERFEYDVIKGNNEFRWTFVRDPSHGWGMNRAWIDNILAAGISTTGITDKEAGTFPESFILYQNYPNPFNPVTQIRFALPKTADVKLSVYNINGQKVAEPVNGSRQAGVHAVDFDGSRLNSGVYYYMLEADGINFSRKMLLVK